MHGNLEPEEKILPKENEQEEEKEVPVLDGYACPYPRRKLSGLNDW